METDQEKKRYASGAYKRRKQVLEQQKRGEQFKKIPKLTSFFVKTNDTSLKASTSEENVTKEINETDISATGFAYADNVGTVIYEEHQSNINKTSDIEATETSIIDSQIIGRIVKNATASSNKSYPSDKANFPDVPTAEQKRLILSMEPCQPKGPFPRDLKKRCFSEIYYKSTSKAGIAVQNIWLSYSPKLNLVYCQPCWLFSERRQQSD